MIAIQIADTFILKNDFRSTKFHVPNLIILICGFVLYRILMHVDTPVGNTLPDMAVTIGICLLYHEVSYAVNGRKREKSEMERV